MGIALKKADYHDLVILEKWPGFSFECWARTRRARRGAYAVSR
jgi:hypothetical protein